MTHYFKIYDNMIKCMIKIKKSMMQSLYSLVSLTTNDIVLTILICTGINSQKRNTFIKAFTHMCFNIILCRYLKMLFMIPLSPHLNILDYAYPSGHMFAATSFYGTLAMESNRAWLHLATLTMLILYGQALVFFGYHNIDDVQTAFCFAMLSLFLYKNIDSIHKNIKLPLFIILSIIINMTMQPGIIPLQRIEHIWLELGLLCGIGLAQHYPISKNRFHITTIIHSMLGGLFYLIGLGLHATLLPFNGALALTGLSFSFWSLTPHTRSYLQKKLEQIGYMKTITS